MGKAATDQRWGWWRRAPRHGVGQEAADFGTTFGLEMSLLESSVREQAKRTRTARAAWWRRLFQAQPRI